jgi:hypothetical protein
MENNKYLDKVIGSLVRGTNIDYEKKLLHPPYSSSLLLSFSFSFFSFLPPPPPTFFSSYCKNTFGLTKEEINYVFIQWRGIMKDKINQ